MKLPMRTFWLLNANINRLWAEEDLRGLNVASHSQQSEMQQSLRGSLITEMGRVVEEDPMAEVNVQRDEEGFAALKAMSGRK